MYKVCLAWGLGCVFAATTVVGADKTPPSVPLPLDVKPEGKPQDAKRSEARPKETSRHKSPAPTGRDRKDLQPRKDSAASQKETRPVQKPATRDLIAAEREAGALEFAQKHHPELEELVRQLKDSNPKEYDRAIRELFRTSERFAQMRGRGQKHYELELEAWKIASRIRVMAARLTLAPDSQLELELRQAVTRQVELKIELLQFEQEQVKSRLKKLESALDEAQKTGDLQAQREFEKLQRGIAKARQTMPKQKVAQSSTNQKSSNDVSPQAAPPRPSDQKSKDEKSKTVQ